ncbi:MAG: DNA-binding protein [Oscillospiraceae bacterium]|jgi:predicted DNA-binding protein with PD1-like motif|nr:DNA-binding protein [Oscillospiraceae bacterium]
MEYKRFKNALLARIDKGEEIHEQLKIIARKEDVLLANVNALGAVGEFSVGLFDPREKKYYSNDFTGDFEIVSLTGTISTMNGEYYAHLHMSAANKDAQVFGGHLSRAVVSATCELVLFVINGEVDRVFSEGIGLNLLSF